MPLRAQESFRELYRQGELDDRRVTVDLPGSRVNVTNLDGPGGQALQEMISRLDRCFSWPYTGHPGAVLQTLSHVRLHVRRWTRSFETYACLRPHWT